jgi:iron complex outermembrane receptor protein
LGGGNPNLQPETSRSRGIGMIYTPQQLTGLDLSLDWYHIEVRNAIGDPGAQAVVDDCYVRNSDAACAYIVRDPVVGTLFQVTDLIQNIRGGIETEGYDLTLNWRHDTPLGHLSAHWVTNYVDYFGEIGQPPQGSTLPDGSIASGNMVGLSSPTISNLFGVIWRWRSEMQVAWETGPWSASLTARYYSSILEDCTPVTRTASNVNDPSLRGLCSNPDHPVLIGGFPAPENRVPSVTFFDFEGTWHAPWRAYVTFGVRNAFDRTPPVSYSAFANSSFPDYDITGRFFYFRYRQQF